MPGSKICEALEESGITYVDVCYNYSAGRDPYFCAKGRGAYRSRLLLPSCGSGEYIENHGKAIEGITISYSILNAANIRPVLVVAYNHTEPDELASPYSDVPPAAS